MTVQAEALRIWTTTPVSEWKAEIAKLPERVVLNGITWVSYRSGVRETLRIAYLNRNRGVVYAGLSAETMCCAGADSLRVVSDEADER